MTPKLTFIQWLKALDKGYHKYNEHYMLCLYYDEIEMKTKYYTM